MISSSYSLAIPEMENSLQNPKPEVLEALKWNWCDPQEFNDAGIPSPWAGGVIVKGVSLDQSLCSHDRQTWVLYDRLLNQEDQNASILSKTTAFVPQEIDQPYFSLYNPYTGVMRVFLWVGTAANASSTGNGFVVDASLTENGNLVATHGFDFQQREPVPTLMDPPTTFKKTWIIDHSENNCWLVLDLFFSYDPIDYTNAEGFERQLNLEFRVWVKKTSTILLDSKSASSTTTQSSSSYSLADYFANGKKLVSLTKSTIDEVKDEYNSGTELGQSIQDDVDKGDYDYLPNPVISAIRTFSYELTQGNIVPGAIKALIPIVSKIPIFESIFITKASTSKQSSTALHLKGSLVEDNSSISFIMPYSSSILSRVPLFAYQKSPQMRKLGLFHFTRGPSSPNNDLATHLESSACLIVMNPNSKSRTIEESSGLSIQAVAPLTQITSWEGIQLGVSFADPENLTHRDRQISLVTKLKKTPLQSKTSFFADQQVQNLTRSRSACIDYGNSRTVSVPPKQLPIQFALGALDRLTLNDRVMVLSKDGSPILSAAISHGTAMLGADASVGELWVKNQAELRDRATVYSRMVASNVSMQNSNTNYIPKTIEAPSTVQFPQPVGMSRYYPIYPLDGYPGAELSGGCNLYSLTKYPNPTNPYCDVSTAGKTQADYNAFVIADRAAKTPLWCILRPSGDPYMDYLASRAVSNLPKCQTTSQYQPISYEEYLKRQIGTRLILPPGNYSHITIRSGFSLELQSGSYTIGYLQMESGSKLDVVQNSGATVVDILYNLIWRAEPNQVEPSKLLMTFIGPSRDLFLETSFKGSFFAPTAKVILGQRTESQYEGQYYARELEVHQGSVVIATPFKEE